MPKGFLFEPAPWHVWRISQTGAPTYYVVLLGEDLGMIPSGTSACVQVFDAGAQKVKSWSFQTGWRNTLESASLEYSRRLDTDLIVIRTAPVINGRDISKQYYAISSDRLRLVRLENRRGAGVQNEYVYPNYGSASYPKRALPNSG